MVQYCIASIFSEDYTVPILLKLFGKGIDSNLWSFWVLQFVARLNCVIVYRVKLSQEFLIFFKLSICKIKRGRKKICLACAEVELPDITSDPSFGTMSIPLYSLLTIPLPKTVSYCHQIAA